MTGKLFNPHLDILERQFQALRDQIGAMPEACRPELESALQALSQTIAALRADREVGVTPQPDPSGGREVHAGQAGKKHSFKSPKVSPSPCEAMLGHIFDAIPDLLTVHDRDFNTILSNWHGYESVPEPERRGQPKCYQVYHHRDRPCDDCHALEVLATGQPVKVTKVNSADGRVREVSAYPIRDESGQVVLVVEHVRDITDRRLAEEALKESEGRFRTLIEGSPESLFLTDAQATILAASRVAAQRLGKSLAEVTGAHSFDLFPPEVAAHRRRIFDQVVATGRAVRLEDVRGDMHFEVNYNPILDADGKVSLVSVLAIDITDRKRAEQALKEKTHLNQLLLDALPCVALLLRPGTREIVASNAEAAKAGALPGAKCFSTWGQRQDPCPWCLAPALWATGKAQHLEIEALGITWDAHWIPVAEDLYMHFAFDVTVRKQAQSALKESEERFRTLFDYAPDAYFLMDLQGNFLDVNRSTEEISGYDRQELIGKNFRSLPLLDDRQGPVMEELLKQAEPGIILGPVEYCMARKDGGQVIMEAKGLPLQVKGESLLLVIARDITARKQTDAELFKKHSELQETAQRLEQSRNMLQLILESVPVRVFWKDRDLRYLGCNTLFARDAGFDQPQQLLGQDDFAMGWREQADLYRSDDRQVMESRRPKMNMVEPQTTPAGANIWLSTSKVPLQGPDGEVFGVLGVYEDVTDRHLAEAALAEQRELMDYVIRHDPNAVAVYDTELRYVFVSERYLNDYGIQEKDIIGKHHYEVFPEMPQRWKEVHQRVLAGAVERSEDDCFERPDGSITYNRWECRPWYRADGRIGGMITYTEVTTARKLAEAALRESEQRFRDITENAVEWVWEVDPQGKYTYSSPVVEHLLGYNHEEILGKYFYDFFLLDEREEMKHAALTAFAAKQPFRDFINRNLHKNGQVVWLSTSGIPILDEQGNLLGYRGADIDITGRKEAEEALRVSEERFRHISSTISDISYSCIVGADGSYRLDWLAGAAERITGYSVEEIKARHCWEFLLVEADQPLFKQHVSGLEAGSSGACELRLRHKNGGIVWVASFAKLVQEPERPEFFSIYGGLVDITARKQAESALAANLQFLQLLLDTIPNPIFFKDAQGVYLGCNKAFEDFLGVTQQEIVGKSVYDLSPRELADEYHRMDLEAFQAPGSQVYESRVQVADGGLRQVVFHKATFPNPTGGVGGLVGIIMDITGLKQAEVALRESEERFRAIFEYAPVGIGMADLRGRFLQANQALLALLGYSVDEFRGVSFQDMTHTEDLPKCQMLLEGLLTGENRYFDAEKRCFRKDGNIVWVHVTMALMRDIQGEPLYLITTVIDITARKQAELALQESEQRFRLMAETIQDVFWIATPDLKKTIYLNPAFEQIWGRRPAELYASPRLFIEAVHPEERERVRSAMLAASAQGTTWSLEYRIIQPGGAGRWIQDRGFPVRDDQGRVILYTGVATDITEQKALEAQLLQAQKMEAVGRLAGGVAHDFNNLLMAITGYGELMRDNVLKDDPLYSHLENILKAGDRAAALTQQLLTFSRQKIVHPQVIDLNQVVLDLEPMLRRLIGEDLDLEVVTDRKLGAVKVDPGQMGQVIMNLVVNARDAMPQGGRLTLKTTAVNFTVGSQSRFGQKPPGAYVKLEVRDTGVGMDEATQSHVFEPFFTTKEPGKGTGLGLSTVYGIVKQSGGYLDLESSPGAGSTFTIYLPRLEAIVEPIKAKIPLTANFRGEETVLLVEDEDVLRGLLAKFLRLYGYTVLEARHGGEALLACERHPGPIDVMVTDLVMPQMSGRELADRLTPLRPEMKVLYMSGYTEDALVQHGVADLSVAFLQKPFKPIELARRVHAVLHPPVSQ